MVFGMLMVAENQKNFSSFDSKRELENISEQYYMLIYKYCYIRLESKNMYSYDITNEVFVLLCEKWDSLKKENVRAWLYRTADILLKAFFRKQQKIRKELAYIEDLDGFTADSLTYEQDFENISDEEIEIYRDEVLDSLSESERELFDMVFTEKLPYGEICEQLLLSRETLKKRLYRLRQKITGAAGKKVLR